MSPQPFATFIAIALPTECSGASAIGTATTTNAGGQPVYVCTGLNAAPSVSLHHSSLALSSSTPTSGTKTGAPTPVATSPSTTPTPTQGMSGAARGAGGDGAPGLLALGLLAWLGTAAVMGSFTF
ncbi:uncharacterized protein L3040_007354 [Drepanopeziza brunnea f. sp. 'multigermtubi']|uniref:uncharacterized protein n=1 Tax=Drepanopeziza brunnea f. sp. 'multigermtubi' TaxID=698441 RepID=UPI002386FA63|nr:hypothetical protein L3040_007354 [Drepanopeziza brunnea f. sp. 'multigermtubi']